MTEHQIPRPVAAVVDAVAQQDAQGFLDAFAPEGVVDDWGTIYSGREQISTWSDREFIGAQGSMDIKKVTTEGPRTTIIADWHSTFANGMSAFTFEVDGDELSSMQIREG